MENILNMVDEINDYTVVDDILAEYEHGQAISLLGKLTNEMAIAEQAYIAINMYECGLTTENSQSRLDKLYSDLNLRPDQIAELTTENADEVINKLKEIIKTMMVNISAKFSEIVANLHRHFAKTKEIAKSLKTYIVSECDDAVDMDKHNDANADQSIMRDKLARFVQCSPGTLEFIINFYNSAISPFAVLKHFKTAIENEKYLTVELVTTFANFKELQKQHFYVPELARDRNPMIVLNVTGITTKILKFIQTSNKTTEFIIETHTGNIKNACTVSESDAPKWNKANLLRILTAIEKFDYNTTAKELIEFNSRIGKTMISATEVLKDNQVYLNYMVKTYNVLNRATMPLLIELTTAHKEVLTIVAYRAKFLKKK